MDLEKVRKAIVEIVKSRKTHCIPVVELRMALEKKMPGEAPDMVRLYDIVKDMAADGLIEYHKAGELYLTGMITQDSVGINGGCVPKTHELILEGEGGLVKRIKKSISRIDKSIGEIKEDTSEIKSMLRRIYQDVEDIKNIVWDIDERVKGGKK